MLVQSSLQVVCHAGVQDSISFVGQKVDIILFHALTAFLGVEFAEAFLLSERVLRDCHVGLRPPRNDKSGGQHCFNGGRYGSGGAFPRLPRRFAPRNDKSEVRAVFRWLVLNGSAFPRLPRLLRSLAMTSLGAFSHSEGRSAELASAALPCHSEERSDVGISSRHLRIRRGPAVPALTAVYRITKPGHVLRRVPVLCAYCSAYFFV